MRRLSPAEIASRIAQDIPDGAVVNLGIGLPELVADFLDLNREIIVHSENGILGMGPRPAKQDEDQDLVNAGKKPVSLVTGGSYFHHADSFVMVRGRHLDICVMGAYEVSAGGDLANWSTGAADGIPGVGGAMDLALGARQVFVAMTHCSRSGAPKIVQSCSMPLTARDVVTRVFTDIAVVEVTPAGLRLIEAVEGWSCDDIQAITGARLDCSQVAKLIVPPDNTA